jgi:hypothetical protein
MRATAVTTARVATTAAPHCRRSHPAVEAPRGPRRSVEHIDIAPSFEKIADLLEIRLASRRWPPLSRRRRQTVPLNVSLMPTSS